MTADDMNSSNPMLAPFWESGLPWPCKLVGLWLADNRDGTGVTRVTMGLLIKACGLPEKTVLKALRTLVEAGAVTIEQPSPPTMEIFVIWGRLPS